MRTDPSNPGPQDVCGRFGPATRAWFDASFDGPTEVQVRGWERIATGDHALLVAPTGSGKTLAAFLWAIDRLTQLPADAPAGVRVLYVSPLKALVHDIERNLRSPLSGVQRAGERLGLELRVPRVDVRTGDTPQRDRRTQARNPGEILVTTPESLFLILGSQARETLRTVETVVVDEIHALCSTKRGVHLALSLERLGALCAREPQRLGLSATVRPLDEVARFLGGDRPVELVDASAAPRLDLSIEVPMEDMENPPAPAPEPEASGALLAVVAKRMANRMGTGTTGGDRGSWAAIYPALLEQIRAHRSTLLFVNSRGLCERLSQRLNDLAGEELVLAHHGSVSHARRAEIEDTLKRGRLRALVATSSLELGIDMGAIDLVILVESPGSVARGLQRVGRAGHGVGETSIGRIFPKFRGDLLECAVVARRMLAGEIESLRISRNALDVLAQQVVAACVDRAWPAQELEALFRRAAPYRELTSAAFTSVLDMLSGHFPSGELADLRPRLRWDRATDELSARRGAAMVTRLNAGTIPDRGLFAVHLGPDGPRIGELEEEMIFESRTGDTFLLGASTWRVEEITRDRVVVSPAPGEPGRLPFWKGDGPGRPLELGRALGAFAREVAAVTREESPAWLRERLPLSERAAGNLAAYVHDQRDATGVVPSDRTIVVERFRDELGDWRICLLSPFGSRVHAPWAMALEEALSARAGVEAQVTWTDDGIVLRLADVEELPELRELLPDPDELVDRVTDRVGNTALFASLFRENAVRSLLVTRRRPNQRNPLWAQRLKTQSLLATVRRHPSFPIVLETYRQALRDVFDLDGLVEILRGIRAREIDVVEVETRSASPFARSLVFSYVAQYLYDGDTPLAERKAQALTLDRGLLRELLGQAELRELVDAGALAELEEELAGTADGRRARDRDELHDLLRRVGDLAADEIGARVEDDATPWLARLFDERRALEVRLAGVARWIAAEDAGLFRDALGVHVPGGLPAGYLAPVDDALLRLLRRFARAHGPFHARDCARRYGLTVPQVEPALRALEAEGVLVLGEIRPGGRELDWCDAEVLRRLKRRTLARLRREVAAVDAATLGRFLPRWHGLVDPPRSGERLLEVVAQLEGLALPWSSLQLELLPQRVPGFHPDQLDLLAATGRIVWVGRGALGPRDGRVALYRRERVGELLGADELGDVPGGELHAALLEHLGTRGACFLFELERSLRADRPELAAAEVEAALWDLVWAGRVTSDTFGALRAVGGAARKGRGGATGGGRWSRVEDLLADSTDGPPSPTERTLARAYALLDRYGVVSREAAVAEDLPGGFGPVYRVLRELEEAGRARRGWFVEGLSGAQFASPGALDRLRGTRIAEDQPGREPEIVTLAAVDPAQPYGALLPWPEVDPAAAPPRRVRGAWVALADGRPVWFLSASRRRLVLFATGLEPAGLAASLRALARLPRRGRKRLSIETIDGVAALDSQHLAAFLENGFARDYTSLAALDGRPSRPSGTA